MDAGTLCPAPGRVKGLLGRHVLFLALEANPVACDIGAGAQGRWDHRHAADRADQRLIRIHTRSAHYEAGARNPMRVRTTLTRPSRNVSMSMPRTAGLPGGP